MSKIDEIRAMREQGKTYQEIANRFNISKQRIGQYLTPTNIHNFRWWNESSCAYIGLRKWLNENKVTMRQFVLQLGYNYNNETNGRIRNKLKCNTRLDIDLILKIIVLTGLTFEELFINDNESEDKE